MDEKREIPINKFPKKGNDFYEILINSSSAKWAIRLLISSIICIIPLLLNCEEHVIFHTSFPFYIIIVILFGYSLYAGYESVIVGVIVLAFSNYLLGQKLSISIINTIINGFQIYLLYFIVRQIASIKTSLHSTRRNRFTNKEIRKNIYENGNFYLSGYNMTMLLLGIIYSSLCLTKVDQEILKNSMIIIASIIFLLTSIKITHKTIDFKLGLFLFGISIVPSVVCSLLSAFLTKVPQEEIISYTLTWSLSNFILLQTFGYLLYQILFLKIEKSRNKVHNIVNNNSKISIDKACYFFALLLWNIIIILLFKFDLFRITPFVYLFPWTLGNILFGANLFFCSPDKECKNLKKNEKLFDWRERRVVTVEHNTQTIIMAISFLLPLGATLVKNLPLNLWYIFVVNIFCGCMAIGLIWVPRGNEKFIAFLQTIKTIFYLYAICFLLISAIALASYHFSYEQSQKQDCQQIQSTTHFTKI